MQNIYDILSDPTANPELSKHVDTFAGQTAISILSKILGLPIALIDLQITEFSKIFAKQRLPDLAQFFFGKDKKRYLAWRRLMLDILLFVHRSIVDDDPRDSLIRACRLRFGAMHANRLYQPASRIGFQSFVELDRVRAIAIDGQLSKSESANFRASLKTMDMLRDDSLAMALGLLSSIKIGQLPDLSAHTTHQPFHPKLAVFYETVSVDVRSSLPFVYRLGCAAGVIDPDQDIDPIEFTKVELITRLLALEPLAYGFEKPSKKRYDRYVVGICNHVEPGAYKRLKKSNDEVACAWTQLLDCIKEVLDKSVELRAREVGRVASKQRLLPQQLTSNWFSQQVRSMNSGDCKRFRTGCYALDDCRNVHPVLDNLLPLESTSIHRIRKRRGLGRKNARASLKSHTIQ